MEAATASGGVAAPPAAPSAEPKRPGAIPGPLRWVEEIAGMAILTWQTLVSAVIPPYSWGGSSSTSAGSSSGGHSFR